MSPSLISDFLEHRALPDQWLGLFILAALAVVAFVALLRVHLNDQREESREDSEGRVRF